MPGAFFCSSLQLTMAYLILVEVTKGWFLSRSERRAPASCKHGHPTVWIGCYLGSALQVPRAGEGGTLGSLGNRQ